MHRGCQALHVEAGHDEAKVDLYKPRQELAASGADLSECLVIEIFSRTSRVLAC